MLLRQIKNSLDKSDRRIMLGSVVALIAHDQKNALLELVRSHIDFFRTQVERLAKANLLYLIWERVLVSWSRSNVPWVLHSEGDWVGPG